MKLIASKPGKRAYLLTTEEECRELVGMMIGVCLECGSERENCEPDARKYKCVNPDCGAMRVYGLEWLVVAGSVVFTEEG